MSLLEMLHFYAASFFRATRRLKDYQNLARLKIGERGADSAPTQAELNLLWDFVRDIDDECERIWLERALERLAHLRNQFVDLGGNFLENNLLTLQKVLWELNELELAIARDLGEHTFIYVPKGKRKYCDKPDFFGKAVLERFPDAKNDIVEAGNCYAVGAHTACVFHLMRVLEYGLRALARNMRVKFVKNPKTELEFRQWGEIIGAIEDRIRAIEKTKKTRARDDKLVFYRDASSHFKYFKDAWRNHVMHTRGTYDKYDTPKLVEHVGDFMLHIATKMP